MERHERICYYNKNRVCENVRCEGDCSSCEIAKEIQKQKKQS